ncbi:MAG: FMN-binding protein [Planctomycetales bacterium]|nr:FMN-binding protein [Planctomycetales bacterium]
MITDNKLSQARRQRMGAVAGILLMALVALPAGADEIELLTGARVQGTVKEIRAPKREFDFELKIGARTVVRTYPFDKVHAVTMNGKRFEVTPKAPAKGGSSDNSDPAGAQAAGEVRRSEAEVRQLISEAGSPPNWFDDVDLDYPKTLDLSWPIKPPVEGWRNQVNVGQYIWDIIHPNTSRWRPGIKLVHHCMTLHANEPELLQRDIRTVGRMYFELLQDYPRAAFWLEKGKVAADTPAGVTLAECYWRLGSRTMALKMLKRPALHQTAIKLLGDMGETDQALAMAKSLARNPQFAGEANMLAADALRRAGRNDEAIRYYGLVVQNGNFRNKEYENRFKSRARESIEALQLSDRAQVSKVADGSYQGSGAGYSGAVNVSITVKDHKLTEVKVTGHQEKQFYSAIDDTTGQILRKQSVQGIDATSRATITSQAIVNATAKALSSGAK